jgi:hypothetical protein
MNDTLSVLTYVRHAVSQAGAVVRFNPNTVGYIREDDPHRLPRRTEQRYDLVPVPLLPGDAADNVPGVEDLRQMAVYLRGDGRVTEISERISALAQLDRIVRNYTMKRPTGASESEWADLVFAKVNEVRAERGLPPIVGRTMTVTFRGVGVVTPVELPPVATRGTLATIPGFLASPAGG